MSVVEVQPMPPGYRLTVANGHSWQSFGWVQQRGGYVVLAIRNGLGSADQAAADAWQHARSASK